MQSPRGTSQRGGGAQQLGLPAEGYLVSHDDDTWGQIPMRRALDILSFLVKRDARVACLLAGRSLGDKSGDEEKNEKKHCCTLGVLLALMGTIPGGKLEPVVRLTAMVARQAANRAKLKSPGVSKEEAVSWPLTELELEVPIRLVCNTGGHVQGGKDGDLLSSSGFKTLGNLIGQLATTSIHRVLLCQQLGAHGGSLFEACQEGLENMTLIATEMSRQIGASKETLDQSQAIIVLEAALLGAGLRGGKLEVSISVCGQLT